MQQKFGKKINPSILQTAVLSDIKKYQKTIKSRAELAYKKTSINTTICPICRSSSSESVLYVYGFEYLQCNKCSHWFLHQSLSESDMNAFYAQNKDYAKAYTNHAQLQYRLKKVALPKVKWVMKQVGTKTSRRRWLDVGCAIGDVIKAVDQHSGWSGIGLDISIDSIALGQKIYGVDLKRQQLSEYSAENQNEQFDVISFFGYLGLRSDPMYELLLAKKHLKKGGYIVIGEENAASFSTLVQQYYTKHSTRHLLPPMTINQFTLDSIQVAMTKVGCKTKASWNFGLDFYEFIKMLSLTQSDFENSPLFTFLMTELNSFQKVIDKKNMGDYLMVIAQAK